MNTKQILLAISALILSGCGTVQVGINEPKELGAATIATFWPETDIFDRDTTVDFGGSVSFATDHEIKAGATAVSLEASEIAQDPNLCDGWALAGDDRPFWHNQETFSPRQHSFSENLIYSIDDDPEYTHLLVYVRLWKGVGETEYCEQHVYKLE